MKVVAIIFGILALLGVVGGSLLLTVRNGGEVSGYNDLGAIGDFASKFTNFPEKGAWQTAQIFSILAFVVGIFGLAGLFMKGNIAMIAAILVALSGILLWAMEPSYDAGSNGPANPKTVAMIVMVNAIIGALCIIGAASTRKKASA